MATLPPGSDSFYGGPKYPEHIFVIAMASNISNTCMLHAKVDHMSAIVSNTAATN